MSQPSSYLFVSLPSSIVPSSHKDDALQSIQNAVDSSNGTVQGLSIPEFKIGTLDALVQQADELGKLDNSSSGVVAKIGDALNNILEGDKRKVAESKGVDDKPLDQYLRSFAWNKVKYRTEKTLAELIDMLQKEINSLDNDVRSKYNQYNSTRTNLTALQRKQTGNLSTKSLVTIVPPSLLINESEYIETHLIAVPNQNVKEFLRNYETISPMIVPRSATEVQKDDEFVLYSVAGFKKHGPEFLNKCRERKWIPRDFKFKQGGAEEEKEELKRVEGEERKLWGECLRMCRTGWSDGMSIWIHVIVLRVFVESVLRYGLPMDFATGLIKTSPKQAKKAKTNLDSAFNYLGGNAFGRDKKGRAVKDDQSVAQDMQAAGGGLGEDYTAYVLYPLEVE
ncbi:MAG: hypothetical protein Q9227_008585 [Pyrenula ochraceoflavens]